ncbi:hypothetical protein TRVL_09498 [Trypanosoma vivax]|nr:hypothetical protein TRVL_09498 [Trypanosoma vivax]
MCNGRRRDKVVKSSDPVERRVHVSVANGHDVSVAVDGMNESYTATVLQLVRPVHFDPATPVGLKAYEPRKDEREPSMTRLQRLRCFDYQNWTNDSDAPDVLSETVKMTNTGNGFRNKTDVECGLVACLQLLRGACGDGCWDEEDHGHHCPE